MHRSDPARGSVTAVAIALFVTLASAYPALAVDVTACGQVVARGEIGDVVADLTCTGGGIVLENGALLRLNGHVITGPGPASSCLFPNCGGVWCQAARCSVVGPGEITGFPMGIWSHNPVVLGRLGRVGATGVVLRGNHVGLRARVATLTGVVARENLGLGLSADSLKLQNVEASANGTDLNSPGVGILGMRLKGVDVRVEDNLGLTGGVLVSSVNLRQATVTGNAGDGVHTAGRLTLRDSIVTGNAAADVSSPRRPRIVNTTCGSSSDQQSGDWDVCTND